MKVRSLVFASLVLASAACHKGEVMDGGVYITRNACPQVGIPAGTGDITLFNPAASKDASAIDVVATITNVRGTCAQTATELISTASFDVVATRRDAAAPRSVTLQYFDVAMQGGDRVVAKRLGTIALNFAAGSQRAMTSSQATVRVSRAATSLPEDVRDKLTRERRAGEVDAAIDPMTDPTVRAAVARATFEQLIGFQLTQEQLRYNATR